MSPTRLLARPMLAAVFVTSGIDVLRNPGPRVAKAESVAPQLASKLGLPEDTELLVRANAGVHIVAGILLSMGKLRRLSALALFASLVPTTYAGHRFWEVEDPRERSQQQVHFLKNLAILGGLILEAVDTEGRPSIGWRSKRAASRASAATAASKSVAKTAGAAAKGASEALGKAKAASVVADKAAGLAKNAIGADVAVGAVGKGRELVGKVAHR